MRLITVFFVLASVASAQATRTQIIEQSREDKAKTLAPDEVSRAEGFLRRFRDQKYPERFSAGYNGLRAKIGNAVTGGGFAIGPEYFREDLANGRLTARAAAQGTTRGYYKLESQLIAPKIAGGKAYLDFLVGHRNYHSIQYYGPGPDSPKNPRSTYRLEDTYVDTIAGWQPWKGIKLGGSLGYVRINTGPGQDSRFASIEEVFNTSLPGLDRQTNYVRPGVFAQIDYRDNPFGAKNGGNYVFQYSWYRDQKLEIHNFRRMDIDLQQHIGFLNKTRVIALRAKSTLTETDRNETVPFYLQPIVGGSDDLRSFRPFRFSGQNALVLNAEYRWEVFAGLDGALFVDGGKVFQRRGQLNFANLERSAGFGLRFNARNATFLRFDVAFGREGAQFWIKFNDVFSQRPFGTTTGQPIY